MIKKRKRVLTVLCIFAAVLLLFLAAVFIYHKISLHREEKLRSPLGQLVEIDGHKMSVYTEGDGEKTLVFMSGGGTCSPILDFKSLYSLLSDKYKIAVVEKFGYGFSDPVDKDRSIESVLSDTRSALQAAGVKAPYILCPHSMSGIEALYWTEKYPEEVSAVIGLDMAVPEYYEHMKINMPVIRFGHLAAEMGLTRLIPSAAESDAIKHGTLTDNEKDIYRAVFYSRTATISMINECSSVKENAKLTAGFDVPQIPMLLFISDGSGGTGFDKDEWRRIPEEYIAGNSRGRYIELDCPHYVHNYEYEAISQYITEFLSE